MKCKMTRKDLYGENVFRVGYCDLYNLLHDTEDAVGYNCGVYGWNWDCYRLYSSKGERIYITTGYRGMVGERVPDELVQKYEDKAKAVRAAWDWRTENYGVLKARMADLSKALVDELLA